MLIIVADGYDDPLNLSARRDRFTCTEFSYAISPDQKSGTVTLLPEKRTLLVSGSKSDYVRVRIFGSTGALLGSMTCARDDQVTWSTVIYKAPDKS